MTYTVASPRIIVDIYPYEGGGQKYTLTQGPILQAVVSKDILQQGSGTFSITLAPGGPNGPNQPPYWSEILTPMSFAVIALERGDKAAIVMLGIVTNVNESQRWDTGSPVARSITVSGRDFGYFFQMETYYALWYLAVTGQGFAPTAIQDAANLGILGQGYLQGDPGLIAALWFQGAVTNGVLTQGIMAGNNGILSKAYVPYNGSNILFPAATGYVFEKYDATIPYGDYFLASESTWFDKFNLMVPYPYYEFFVTTAPPGAYLPTVSGITLAAQGLGYPFQSSGLPASVYAAPTVVARRNPFPVLTATGSNASLTFTGIDTSLWNALTVNQPDFTTSSFIQSAISFDESEVKNLYLLNPTWAQAQFGGANGSVAPFISSVVSLGDQASIERYGYRPANGSFNWFCDPTGVGAVNSTVANQAQTCATVLSRFASYYHPTPLMGKGRITLPLRPDILPGTRFRYCPFKNDATWDFYCSGIEHNYVFGGPSTTTLTLGRGLPTAVYSNVGGILFDIHVGNAQRLQGQYVSGLPAGSGNYLSPLNLSSFGNFYQQLAAAYSGASTQ